MKTRLYYTAYYTLLFLFIFLFAALLAFSAEASCWDGGYCTPTPARPQLYHVSPHQRYYDAMDSASGGWHVPPGSYGYGGYGASPFFRPRGVVVDRVDEKTGKAVHVEMWR